MLSVQDSAYRNRHGKVHGDTVEPEVFTLDVSSSLFCPVIIQRCFIVLLDNGGSGISNRISL